MPLNFYHGDIYMAEVIRAKNFNQPQRYVKVMGRLSDPKRRERIAKTHERDTGHKMSDPHQFHFYVGFPIESFGFEGAFNEAYDYIESQECIHLSDFEWKITGGEW